MYNIDVAHNCVCYLSLIVIDEPRRAISGNALPSARAVSVNIFEDKDVASHVHTLLMINYGQFLDHDFTRTAVTKLSTDENGEWY